ncbi:MAG: hypothetical protein QM730_15245 [Anaerolineales bacterium]
MKNAPALQVEEIDGDQFPDRDSAQAAALPLLAESLQAIIRNLLEFGVLVKIDGVIMPISIKEDMTDQYAHPPRGLSASARVWAYLRDSGGPSQEQSVDQQEQEIIAYCKRHSLVLGESSGMWHALAGV